MNLVMTLCGQNTFYYKDCHLAWVYLHYNKGDSHHSIISQQGISLKSTIAVAIYISSAVLLGYHKPLFFQQILFSIYFNLNITERILTGKKGETTLKIEFLKLELWLQSGPLPRTSRWWRGRLQKWRERVSYLEKKKEKKTAKEVRNCFMTTNTQHNIWH